MTARRIMAVMALAACTAAKVELGDSDAERPADSGGNHTGLTDTADTAPQETGDTTSVDTADSGSVDTADPGDTVPIVIAIDLITPAIGSTEGGEIVVLEGGPFSEDAVVTFGSTVATVTAGTPSTLSVLTPAVAEEQTVDVEVVTSAGSGVLARAYTYEEPCDGITASPSYVRVGNTADVDVSITLDGCATGIAAIDEMYVGSDGTPYGVEWLSAPAEVDGSATVTLRYHYWSRFTPSISYYPALSTDQGRVTVEVDPT